ncbi:cell division protein FtsQ/DivIB [Belliella kenyensis]|uniref:Cell division protein FtsQ/DivIB n=1 Tax=Belliella kenyensis TaxID=1472724 RepID=A0ABV8EQG4_9BACT|nr:cell division protein [Belliella kenyensis]MCH7403837.1 cell division protein [Belliella kenyensis]MDN3602451.1 cell division protein [Belliella kenyensis]
MKTRFRKTLVFSVLVMVLLGFIAFVEKQSADKRVNSIHVKVNPIADVYFVEESDLLSRLYTEFPMLNTGVLISEVNLNQMEDKVSNHPFVKNAEVFSDLKGNILVEIDQHKPMARIVRPMAADGYISTEGIILPTSPKYTTRVLTLEGSYAERLLLEERLGDEHEGLMKLIKFIESDEFWRAQITGLEINRKNDIRMYQQVGKQVIEFGDADHIEEKFKKISLFYEEILPAKGWNTYSRVNVKYKDQIICE